MITSRSIHIAANGIISFLRLSSVPLYICTLSSWSFILLMVAQMVKNLPAMEESRVQSLGWEDPLRRRMATLSSILAREIPWTEEPSRLQSIGLQRVRHNWATNAFPLFSPVFHCAYVPHFFTYSLVFRHLRCFLCRFLMRLSFPFTGRLLWLFFLPVALFSQIPTWPILLPSSNLCSNATFSRTCSLTAQILHSTSCPHTADHSHPAPLFNLLRYLVPCSHTYNLLVRCLHICSSQR